MGRKKVILRLLAACLTCAIVLRLLNDAALSPARKKRGGPCRLPHRRKQTDKSRRRMA